MNKTPLAIIGIGLRLPGNICHPDGLWSALKEGKDCITDVPDDRWSLEKYYDPDPNKSEKVKSKKGGFIKDMKGFDAEFFDIYPKVAHNIDPRQRHLLEVTYEAFEDAGLTLPQLSGSKTAVIMGVFLGDETKKNTGADLAGITPHSAMGSADTTVPARISYQFNLTGPSLAVDTACSSSLVATHIACNSIWSGDAEMAIAGGVNIMTSHEHNIALSKGGFLSSEGHCKSFDASGDGYVRGEGAAVVIIKPLKKAEEDGDTIYAVIRNTVSNSDGYTADGITVPNEFAQIEMLKKAYGDISIDPATVDFIEAHGTGTFVGDPKECYAFGNVFADNRKEDKPLIIGSIKSNVGHTEAVAGVAGLIKLALCLKNKQIPQNLHFKTPNPRIKFDEWKLKVPTELTPWPTSEEKKAIGGVNSFGAGGTNAHAVLEEYTPSKTTANKIANDLEEVQFDFPYLFSISAKTESALKDLTAKYLESISQSNHSLSDFSYSTLTKRTPLTERLAIISSSKEELLSSLNSYLTEQKSGLITGKTPDKKPKIAFVCSGQGPQWYAMGRQLMSSSKIFYNTIKEIDAIFQKLAGYSLLDEMSKSSQESKISQTRIAQPAIMALQVGLIHMYEALGIKPEGVVGHSVGEVAAAYSAGALNLEQAVEVIYHRSREQDKASNSGKMLATDLTYNEASKRIEDLGNKVSIAAINGPKMTVLSGDTGPLEIISKALEQEERFGKFLQVNIPFHSYHLDQIEEGMMTSLANLKPSKATIPLYSTVTGNPEDGLHLTNRYWFKNARDTVHFFQAIEKMIKDGFDTFLEIAPHPVLGAGIEDALTSRSEKGVVISSLSRKVKEFEANKKYEDKDFLTSIAKLYLQGVEVNFNSLFAGQNVNYVKLPHYAWQHQEYWSESKEHADARLKKPIHPFITSITKLLSAKNNTLCELTLDPRRETFLKDHQIGGAIVFPGTGQFEAAIALGKEIYQDKFSHLEDIHFHRALFLPEDNKPEARIEITSSKGDYKIWSRKDESEEWTHNGSGRICTQSDSSSTSSENLESLKQRITEEVDVDKFYTQLREGGLHYGPHFKLIKQIWKNDNDEILARIELPDDDTYILNQYNALPSLTDAALHVILSRPEDGVFLPVSCKSYKVLNNITKTVWSYAKVAKYEGNDLAGSIASYNDKGEPALQAEDIKLKYLKNSRKASDDPYDGIYEHEWVKSKLESKSPKLALEPNQHILLITDNLSTNELAANLVNKFNKDQLITVSLNTNDDNANHHLNPSSKADFENLFKDIAAQGKKIRKIINLWPCTFKVSESDNDETLAKSSKKLTEPTLYLFQEVAKLDYSLEIYQVTSNADFVTNKDKEINFLQGSLYGMGRVFNNEYPQFSLRMIDLGCSEAITNAKKLYQEITKEEKEPFETEVAIRDYGRFARKLSKVTKTKSKKDLSFSSEGTYLITGGASGLGLALAKWMWQKGARSFALVSRSGPKYANDKKIIQELINSGAKVIWKEVTADVTSEQDIRKVVNYIQENMSPLKGVIHSAGILHDATYPNMTIDSFMEVYRPKVLGAWNLHQATLGCNLDLFLMISSVSSILGIAGQNNYSSANSFLNYLAVYRNSLGLVGKAACFGALSGEFAGMSKEGPEIAELVYRTLGIILMSRIGTLEKLKNFILSESIYWTLSPMKWSNFSSNFSHALKFFSFKEILVKALKDYPQKIYEAKSIVLSARPEEQLYKVNEVLKNSLSRILGISVDKIDAKETISNLGLDSLMLNQFRNWLSSELEVNTSIMELSKNRSLEELSNMVLKTMLGNKSSARDLGEKEVSDVSGIANDKDLEVLAKGWLVRAKSGHKPNKVRIFCLHPIGAGASIFSYFLYNPPKDTEVTAIQMPGRENRISEGYYSNMSILITDLAKILSDYIDRETILWGHSWGGVVLYEVAKYMRVHMNDKYRNLKCLVVSGSIAPQLTSPWKERDSIKETARKASVEKVLSTVSYIDDEEFVRNIYPIMQKDMKLLMTYDYKNEERLSIPIIAFGAKEDDVVLLSEIEQWKNQTTNEFKLHTVHGDHWFLSRNRAFIIDKIEEFIKGNASSLILNKADG